jgi:hypothetical protein
VLNQFDKNHESQEACPTAGYARAGYQALSCPVPGRSRRTGGLPKQGMDLRACTRGPRGLITLFYRFNLAKLILLGVN